jgi:hypothetical protein
MSRRPSTLPLLLLVLPALMSAAPYTAFRDGEKFTYKVGFAIFSRAGEITIEADADTGTDGRALMRIINTTSTKGLVRGVYTLENRAEVLIDLESGRILSTRETGQEGKRESDSETIFDYEAKIARHVDRNRPGRSGDIPIPDGNPLDLISALVQTRDWNLKPGDERDILVHFGRDLYPLTIKAVQYEEVRTPLGRYRALVLVPEMRGTPKGLFKRGGEIKVWIAQDGSNLPVRMQLKLNYGTATLLLSDYRPPAVGPDSARATAKSSD